VVLLLVLVIRSFSRATSSFESRPGTARLVARLYLANRAAGITMSYHKSVYELSIANTA
jgi:hypothetical protein